MPKWINKKTIYLLGIAVICLLGVVLTGTYAKFASGFTTEDDIVGLDLAFNIGISNMEEYEEVRVDANSYTIFNVEVTNSTSATAYYGIWYKMVNPKELNDSIVIGKYANNEVATSGSINASEKIMATIIIKNSSKENMKVNIGVESSTTSTNDIEYLGGKTLISGNIQEADYYYDEATSKYISTSDSNITFTTTPSIYSYTGSAQTFTANHNGVYKLEAWGAQGGSTTGVDASYPGNVGGKGGYVSGYINISKNENIYIYAGKQGGVVNFQGDATSKGYNGGGIGGYEPGCAGGCIKQGGGGGGATDFRLANGTWNDANSLRSRIMVAGGGGGPANWTNAKAGGAAGGLTGISGTESRTSGTAAYTNATGGTQIAGGTGGIGVRSGGNGTFGIGGNSDNAYGGGGGGGYFGGGGGSVNSSVVGSGAGGSSYISGHQGSVAITSATDQTPKSGCTTGTTDISCSYHYSGKIFKNPIMIAGNANMPNQAGTGTMTGNSGNGYAKVTSVVPTITATNLSINLGDQLDESKITCNDNGSGCKIVRISDTTNLSKGNHTISIFVMDDYGIIYRYDKTLQINVITAATFIQNLYNDGSALTTVNIGGDTSKPTVTQNATQGIMLDNNGVYRYYGSNPNNYVTFNGELWRIISVSNVKSSTSDATGSMRLKIIHRSEIGNYSYDSSDSTVNSGWGVSDWSKSDLMTELNTLYYNQQSGICYNGQNNAATPCDFTTTGLGAVARNMIDNALWYLGAHPNRTSNIGYANNYYVSERGTNVWDCSIADDGSCPRPTTWTGKIGLIYPSDYLYATDQSVCTAQAKDWDSSCSNKDWLFRAGAIWTITSANDMWGATVYCIGGDTVSVTYEQATSQTYNVVVRPTLYLKSDVFITSGNGTRTNPYQLAI